MQQQSVRKRECYVPPLLSGWGVQIRATWQEKASVLRKRRAFSLSVAEGKGPQDQASTMEQRSRHTRECNTIGNICNHKVGLERSHPGSCYHHSFQDPSTGQVNTQSLLVSSQPCSLSTFWAARGRSPCFILHVLTHPASVGIQRDMREVENGSHSKPGVSSTIQGEGQESASPGHTWKINLCLRTSWSTWETLLRNNKRRNPSCCPFLASVHSQKGFLR